jgi:hypothetical protein
MFTGKPARQQQKEAKMLLKTTLAAAAISLGSLVAAAPANAGANVSVTIEFGHPGYSKYHNVHYRTLSPHEVRRILRRKGFREIRYVDRRGSIYRAHAENYRGRDVLVTVSARTGQILDVDRLGWRG